MDVNSQDVGGWSALHEAAYAGRYDFIELLLSCGANINIQNTDGATPIFTAAQYGNDSCLKLLLKNGADINLLTVDNASPLFIAAQEGLTNCINILLGASKYFFILARDRCSLGLSVVTQSSSSKPIKKFFQTSSQLGCVLNWHQLFQPQLVWVDSLTFPARTLSRPFPVETR